MAGFLRFSVFCLCLVLTLLPGAVPARAEDVFTVSGVKVDVKAENAVAAREKAFAQAQTTAFAALALRLLGEEDAKQFPVPDTATISTMIQDFEITAERLSAVEYIATYTFRFDGDAVRQRFNMGGLQNGAIADHAVLVLPFVQRGQTMSLWRDDNEWLKAWGRNDSRGGLTRILAPLGDIRDIADVGDDQALTYRRDGLNQMLGRYGANEAVVLVAVPGPADAADVPVDVSIMIYRTDLTVPDYVQTIKVTPDPNSTASMLYDKAVRETRAALQNDWKARAEAAPGSVPGAAPGVAPAMLTARVYYTTMQQWVETRQALGRVPAVAALRVRSVTPREAVVEIDHAGDEILLRAALEQQDIVLTPPQIQHAYSAGAVYGLQMKKYMMPY